MKCRKHIRWKKSGKQAILSISLTVLQLKNEEFSGSWWNVCCWVRIWPRWALRASHRSLTQAKAGCGPAHELARRHTPYFTSGLQIPAGPARIPAGKSNRGEVDIVKFVKGIWHHRGRSYATLWEAMEAAWAQLPGQKKAALGIRSTEGDEVEQG